MYTQGNDTNQHLTTWRYTGIILDNSSSLKSNAIPKLSISCKNAWASKEFPLLASMSRASNMGLHSSTMAFDNFLNYIWNTILIDEEITPTFHQHDTCSVFFSRAFIISNSTGSLLKSLQWKIITNYFLL